MKSIILTHSKYQDQEVIYPYYRLREGGGIVVLVAESIGPCTGILGTSTVADACYSMLDRYEKFDLLMIPGGVKATEKLRQDADALRFVREWFAKGKATASLCNGAQVLISARVPLKGRHLTGYPAIRVDIENAGAEYVEDRVVVDGNLVSSPHYDYMAPLCAEALRIAGLPKTLHWWASSEHWPSDATKHQDEK